MRKYQRSEALRPNIEGDDRSHSIRNGLRDPEPGRPSGRRAGEESNREFTVSNFLSETKCWLSVLTQEVGKVKYE